VAEVLVKPYRDAAQYRDASDSDDLIGSFPAWQRRERFFISNNYSHYVFVFRSTIMLVETNPLGDKAAAWAKRVLAALPFVNWAATALNVPQVNQALRPIRKVDRGVAAAAARLPKSRASEAILAAHKRVTPDLLDKRFAGRVHEVPKPCITSAVLNRGPLDPLAARADVVLAAAQLSVAHVPVAPAVINTGPLKAELIIEYRDPQRNPKLELWLGTDNSQPLDDIATMMREMLGERFSERHERLRAVRAMLPLKSAQVDWTPGP
jgi:hypothetical protein